MSQFKETSLFRRRIRSFWVSSGSRLGLLVMIAILVLCVIPKSWLPYDPIEIDLSSAKTAGFWSGEWNHPLGTDFLGRDMLSRTIFATRLTLIVSASAVALASVFGTVLGLVSGYFGNRADEVISWLIDVQLAFPVIALAVAIVAFLGGSLTYLVIVLAITSWPTIARVVRAQTLSARNEVYVEAALAVGVPTQSILLRHILPNVLSPLFAVVSYEVSRLVLTESAMSFLGLGVASPQVTWGGMIGDGRAYVYDAWWTATIPGTMIAILVLAFNFVGDGLRDAFDPAGFASNK